MRHTFIFSILTFILVFTGGSATWAGQKPTSYPRSTWLWNSSLLHTDSDAVLSFLGKEKISLLYVQIDPDIPNAVYRDFIREARKRRIQVQALWGDPSWVTAAGRATRDSAKAWIRQYQEEATKEERFAGIHLDVEPYLLPNWNSEQKALVLAYQQMVEEWKEEAASLKLAFGVDIPFWYDKIHWVRPSLSKWIIQNTDATTIMSYRNQIGGPNGVLSITRKDREYAQQHGKTIYLSLETERSTEGDHISFGSYADLQLAIRQLESGRTGVKGIAIHHYTSLKTLKEDGSED